MLHLALLQMHIINAHSCDKPAHVSLTSMKNYGNRLFIQHMYSVYYVTADTSQVQKAASLQRVH